MGADPDPSCGRGGISRRAGFGFQWGIDSLADGEPRAGASPVDRTLSTASTVTLYPVDNSLGRRRLFRMYWLPVYEALSYACLYRGQNALAVLKFTIVIAELKFGQIAVQVLPADVVIDAVQATLEQPEHALNRVRMHITPDVFLALVIHGLMATLKVLPDLPVGTELV